jgi:hypothetical protein
MDNSFLLAKSDFLLFLEAPLHLWAGKHNLITKTPSALDIHLMEQGYQVEALAKEYLEKQVLKPGEHLIFQETLTERQFSVRTDGLIHNPAAGSYDLCEVKSGTSIKKENLYDAAYQYLVVNKHIKLERVFILHLNSEYVRYSDLNLAELFIAEDVTEEVLDLLDEVEKLRDVALETALSPSSEGLQSCLNPKECPCPDLCFPGLPESSIFDIPRLSAKKKVELLSQGVIDIKDVPKTYDLNSKQRQIVDVAQSNQEIINTEAIQKVFQSFSFPLYFLDYETCLSAIPLFDGYKPQQQMVFQYSLHKMESLKGDIQHKELLAITKDDPSRSLVRQLRDDIGSTGTVLVWNKTFEMSRNKEMALVHPEYAAFLEELNDRIYDLGDIINLGYYLHPQFKGRWSLKNVLPVMVPELSYEEMEIGKGDQAMTAWWALINGNLPDEDAEKTKTALLEYCKLDTWAMVKIWGKIFEAEACL